MVRQYRLNILAVALLLMAGIAMVLSSGDRSAFGEADDGQFKDHPSVVPSDPVMGYPRILDTPTYDKPWGNGTRTFRRQTYAIDMVNDFIVSGGDFLDVELQDGTVVSQPNLAIFDTVTKQLACPGLVAEREVRAVVRGHEPNTAIIGGAFTSVTGTNGTFTRGKIAKIRLDTCEVDENWRVQGLNGQVQDLAITGDRLFLAGDFLSIEGQPIAHLAEVNLKDATLNPAFSITFTGGAAWRKITTIGAKGEGRRFSPCCYRQVHRDRW